MAPNSDEICQYLTYKISECMGIPVHLNVPEPMASWSHVVFTPEEP